MRPAYLLLINLLIWAAAGCVLLFWSFDNRGVWDINKLEAHMAGNILVVKRTYRKARSCSTSHVTYSIETVPARLDDFPSHYVLQQLPPLLNRAAGKGTVLHYRFDLSKHLIPDGEYQVRVVGIFKCNPIKDTVDLGYSNIFGVTLLEKTKP